MLGKLHDGAMIVFADATMLCAHVYRPSTVHLPTSNCILCGNTTLVQTEHCPQPKRAMLSVLPIATSSDLDLQSTNSNAVRQLCILGLDAITNSKTEQTILRFVSDLTLHVGYTVAHQRVQTTRTFHVLTLFFTSDKEQTHTIGKNGCDQRLLRIVFERWSLHLYPWRGFSTKHLPNVRLRTWRLFILRTCNTSPMYCCIRRWLQNIASLLKICTKSTCVTSSRSCQATQRVPDVCFFK